MLDTVSIRARFPALTREQNGKPVIYFDNPAGTQVPRETLDGYQRYLTCHNANTGGAFAASQETDQVIADGRAAACDLLNAQAPEEIVFGQNMTSLTFTVAHALGAMLRPGDEIVTTRLEHDANIAPWLSLQDRGIVVRWIDIDPETATLDLTDAEQVITERTRLLAIGYASNAFGTINDVRRVTRMAHAVGAWVFVDAVHYGPHGSIDVQALECDLLACSAYKFFGPHLGILWGRMEVLETLPAYRVRPAGTVPPGKWETGTQNHEAISAFCGTVAYLASLAEEGAGRRNRLVNGMGAIQRYERALSEGLIGGLTQIPGVRIYGITDPARFGERVPTVSFTVGRGKPGAIAEALAERGIFAWSGNHYAPEPLGRLGVSATNRIGLVHYNTPDEIDRFLKAIEEIAGDL